MDSPTSKLIATQPVEIPSTGYTALNWCWDVIRCRLSEANFAINENDTRRQARRWMRNEMERLKGKIVPKSYEMNYFCRLLLNPLCFFLGTVPFGLSSVLIAVPEAYFGNSRECSDTLTEYAVLPWECLNGYVEDLNWVSDQLTFSAVIEVLKLWAEKGEWARVLQICKNMALDTYGYEVIEPIEKALFQGKEITFEKLCEYLENPKEVLLVDENTPFRETVLSSSVYETGRCGPTWDDLEVC